MFNSKKDFAIELLEGRKFVNINSDKHAIFSFDEGYVNPFRYGSQTMNGAWDEYSLVEEYCSDINPVRGNIIRVSNYPTFERSVERVFVVKDGSNYICQTESKTLDSKYHLFSWKYAKECK